MTLSFLCYLFFYLFVIKYFWKKRVRICVSVEFVCLDIWIVKTEELLLPEWLHSRLQNWKRRRFVLFAFSFFFLIRLVLYDPSGKVSRNSILLTIFRCCFVERTIWVEDELVLSFIMVGFFSSLCWLVPFRWLLYNFFFNFRFCDSGFVVVSSIIFNVYEWVWCSPWVNLTRFLNSLKLLCELWSLFARELVFILIFTIITESKRVKNRIRCLNSIF